MFKNVQCEKVLLQFRIAIFLKEATFAYPRRKAVTMETSVQPVTMPTISQASLRKASQQLTSNC